MRACPSDGWQAMKSTATTASFASGWNSGNWPMCWPDLGQRRVDQIAQSLPTLAWERVSAGSGSKGEQLYDWTLIPGWEEDGWSHGLQVRRSIEEQPEHAYYRFYAPTHKTALATLVRVAGQRWQIGVSSQGHINQPVQVRPRPTDSSLVAGEAPWRESKTVKPSDNMLRKEYVQLARLQRAVNADVASLHETPEAETVDNARKQQEPAETSPMRRLSPAGYQRRHGGKEDVSTGEALGIRRRNFAEEMTAITLSGKCRHRCQGGGSGRSTVDGRAAKRARREGPGPVSIPLGKVRQG